MDCDEPTKHMLSSVNCCNEELLASMEEQNQNLELFTVKQEKFDAEIAAKIKAIESKIKKEKETVCNSINKDKAIEQHNGDSADPAVKNCDDDGDSSTTTTEDEEEEEQDKKSIEPVKSSNEILAELFQVFNAAPPEELLDDKSLLKKNQHKHKKHKKEKRKKHKKSKLEEGECADGDDTRIKQEDSGTKHKHKKMKKQKHKDDESKNKHKEKSSEKSKDRSRSKDRSKEERERKRSRERSKSKDKPKRERTRSKDRDKPLRTHIKADADVMPKQESSWRKRRAENDDAAEKDEASAPKNSRSSERSQNKFYNGYKDVKVKEEAQYSSHKSRHDRTHNRDGHISEVSLSDEETFLKERERHDSSKRRRYNDNDTRAHNKFYAGVNRNRSRDRDYTHHQGRRRSRSRSRSHSRSRDLGIDKKRLLEIARKNAISMFKHGNLPGCSEMSEEVKDKVLLKMRYGGRTVQDLTDFCKKISNGEQLSELSSDEDEDVDKQGNAKAFHHPFQLKEREPIVMHIRNAIPVPLRKNEEQTKAITMQFPVSSGQQHRNSEVWVPVAANKTLVPLPALPAAIQSTSIFKKAEQKNIYAKTMPKAEQQEPAFRPVGGVPDVTTAAATAATETLPDILKACPQNEVAAPLSITAPATTTTATAATPMAVPDLFNATQPPPPLPPACVEQTFVADVPAPSESIFPDTGGHSLDVSNIISKRLNAMRRLQENPMDSEAIKMMYNSQREMTSWASSKHLPGQFTGSTGANILSAQQLNSGPQVWARRNQLTSTKPVTGGMGMHLLQKMGWKPGEGLGREKTGSLQPLLLDVKLDKHGLVSKEDNGYRPPYAKKQHPNNKKQRPNNSCQVQQNLEEKHPVCLLNELTSKRKWTPPLYTLVNEDGPSHSRVFLFSVGINGMTYTPNQASNTKKEAKLVAARYCLQQIGIIP